MNLRDKIYLLLNTDNSEHNDEGIAGYNEAVKDILALIDNARTVTQPEKVMSVIDLENPPAFMKTATGAKVILVGKVQLIEFEYVLQIFEGSESFIAFSNREATEFRNSYRERVCITIQKAPVKKTGWINLYDSKGDKSHYPSAIIYSTRELAVEAVGRTPLIDTIQITWEE